MRISIDLPCRRRPESAPLKKTEDGFLMLVSETAGLINQASHNACTHSSICGSSFLTAITIETKGWSLSCIGSHGIFFFFTRLKYR